MKSNIKVASNVTLPAPFNTIAHFYLDVIRGVSYECRFRCPKSTIIQNIRAKHRIIAMLDRNEVYESFLHKR